MRWQLYINQTQGAGDIALAITVSWFGLISWWYLINRSPWLIRWTAKLNNIFWIVIGLIYLLAFCWLCFFWPG